MNVSNHRTSDDWDDGPACRVRWLRARLSLISVARRRLSTPELMSPRQRHASGFRACCQYSSGAAGRLPQRLSLIRRESRRFQTHCGAWHVRRSSDVSTVADPWLCRGICAIQRCSAEMFPGMCLVSRLNRYGVSGEAGASLAASWNACRVLVKPSIRRKGRGIRLPHVGATGRLDSRRCGPQASPAAGRRQAPLRAAVKPHCGPGSQLERESEAC
jgi:hypothetical protein